MSPIYVPGKVTLRQTWQPMDPDAAAYITAVEAADGLPLEEKVKIAIDNFVLGCKADGIWSAIKASCILAGARTLAGALVPLVGTAPTNVGGLFVSGDYNRKTGMVGNGSTKYLNSNRAVNADLQNNKHLSIYTSTAINGTLLGSGQAASSFSSLETSGIYLASAASPRGSVPVGALGFIGASRNEAASFTARVQKASQIVAATSAAATASVSYPVYAFSSVGGLISGYSNSRLAFYSIGESLDLAKLDARVTDLINAFEAAIP